MAGGGRLGLKEKGGLFFKDLWGAMLARPARKVLRIMDQGCIPSMKKAL
jgi:hypothetical protein